MTSSGTVCSSACQVHGARELATYFRPLPTALGPSPLWVRGMGSYSKIPHAWWPKIAAEDAAGMSGLKLAQKGR
jgi:hypothetical protein